MPNTHKERRFGDVTLSHDDSGYRIDYGPSRGAEWKIQDFAEVREKLSEYADRELTSLTKQLEAIAKLRRYLRKEV